MQCVYIHTGDVGGMLAVNSSSGQLYVDGVVDREHASLLLTDGVLHIIVKVLIIALFLALICRPIDLTTTTTIQLHVCDNYRRLARTATHPVDKL